MHPVELVSILVFFVGFYGLTTNRNIIKTIIFSSMMEVAVVMFWLSIGFREGVVAPIVETMDTIAVNGYVNIDYVADPLSQALMITAIVIGISVTAIKTIMFVTLYRKHKTADWDIAKARNAEIQ